MQGSESFKKSLDEEYNFPATYNFKFIVATESKNKVIDLLPEAKCSEKKSRNLWALVWLWRLSASGVLSGLGTRQEIPEKELAFGVIGSS